MPIVIMFCSLKQDAQWDSVTWRKVEKLLFLPKAMEKNHPKDEKVRETADRKSSHFFANRLLGLL